MIIKRFDVSKKRLRTVHINPAQTDEFCLAGLDKYESTSDFQKYFSLSLFRSVNLWDLRNMSTMKYCLQTNYSCYGAYYNQAGSHIMAATRDDHVTSFSSDDIRRASDPLDVPPTKRVQHRNYVNRFVTPFTAQPYAASESHFLIGSNAYPRAVNLQMNFFRLISLFIYLDHNFG